MSSIDTQKVIKGFEKEKRKRTLQKEKKGQRNTRQQAPPRRNDWLDLADEDAEVDYEPSFERIMPRGERDRRQAVEQAVQRTANRHSQPAAASPGEEGRVVEVSGEVVSVRLQDRVLRCSLRGAVAMQTNGFMNGIAVGDRVLVGEDNAGYGVIEQVLPRRGIIARRDPGTGVLQRLVAANIDQLLIVASWRNPNLWPELIDRYLITALRNEITPVICVNKIDLAASADEIEEMLAPYTRIGYPLYLTSASSGTGVDRLRERLADKTSLLAGLSGVGKSSLLNAIQPRFDLRTGSTNEVKGQGRHTTTQAVMLPIAENGFVIDTPGIREFGLVALRQGDVTGYYPEIAEHAAACQFSNCSHSNEPGCAVRKAVKTGAVSRMRFDSYTKIRASLPA